MENSQLYFYITAFVSGIFLWNFEYKTAYLFVAIIILVLIFIWISNSRNMILWASFFIVFGFLRIGVYEQYHKPDFNKYLNKKVELQGVVVEEPKEKSFYTEVIIQIQGFKKKQKVLVQAPFFPDFEFGDKIKAVGTLKLPKDFKTDSGRIFPYKKFLAKEKIYYILSKPSISIISKGNGNKTQTVLFDFKNNFINKIHTILPRPESSLLSGMLIAGKGGLGQKLENDFKEIGLVHIVVLSGYNVTIVAEAFVKTLFFLPRSFALGMGASGIILFCIMAGGSSTIVRASIMALIALIGKQTGNTYNALRGLFVAGTIMVVWNPLILRYDPSFHLSFMATFALIVFSPKVKTFFGNFGETAFGEIISSTIAVQLFLLPYLIWMNGDFSWISFPANLLVLPFIPFTMLSGFVAVVVSFLNLEVTYPFAFVSFTILKYILRIVEIGVMI